MRCIVTILALALLAAGPPEQPKPEASRAEKLAQAVRLHALVGVEMRKPLAQRTLTPAMIELGMKEVNRLAAEANGQSFVPLKNAPRMAPQAPSMGGNVPPQAPSMTAGAAPPAPPAPPGR